MQTLIAIKWTENESWKRNDDNMNVIAQKFSVNVDKKTYRKKSPKLIFRTFFSGQ